MSEFKSTVTTYQPPEVLTVHEAAALLQIGTKRVVELVLSGDLPGRKVGVAKRSQWRFSRAAIMRWLEADAPRVDVVRTNSRPMRPRTGGRDETRIRGKGDEGSRAGGTAGPDAPQGESNREDAA